MCGETGFGGAERDRTADLDVANVALSQLSYGPQGNGADTVRTCALSQARGFTFSLVFA